MVDSVNVKSVAKFIDSRTKIKLEKVRKDMLKPEEFKEYLENTFFNNYGYKYNGEDIHIDHITPLATATTIKEVEKLCYYTNLQMLKPEDNLEKGKKLDWSLDEKREENKEGKKE